jgi:Flp pilus assembly protein TadD
MTHINRRLLIAIATVLTVFTSCSYKQMVKMAQDQEITVEPSPLELHGDSVIFEMSAKLPVGMLKKNRLYTLKTYYRYGEDTEFDQITFADTEFPNQKVEQPTMSSSYSFYYTPKMKSGEVMLQGVVSNLEKTKFKSTSEIEIAKGVITTSKLVKASFKPIFADHGYNNKEELIPVNVEFLFEKGRSRLRGSEIKSNDGQKLDAYIASKNTTRTVTITGSHSPEGLESINSELSEERAKVIKDFYFRKMRQYDYKNMADSIKFDTKVIFQDWNPFKKELSNYDGLDQDTKSEILSIINQSGKSFKEKEKELQKKSYYSKLMKDVYPELRFSRTEILSVKEKKTDAEITVLAKAIVDGTASADTLSKEEFLYAATLTPLMDEKENIYQTATKKYDSWVAHNNLGVIYLKKAVKNPSNISNASLDKAYTQFELANKKQENAESLNNMAGIDLIKVNKESAMEKFNKAAKAKATSAETAKSIAAGQGAAYIMKGEYANAIDRLTKAGDAIPDALYNIGLARLLSKDLEKAETSLEAAIYANDKHALAYYCSAIVGARTNNEELLKVNLTKAVEINPDLRDKAMNDLEFIEYKDKPVFMEALK